MQKLLKKILIFVIAFFITSSGVFAQSIDCTYPGAGLTITYSEDDVKIDHEKFAQSDYYVNLFSIVKWGSGKYATDEIYIDQTLYEKYQGYSCPTEMYVCEYGEWTLDLPSLVSVGYDIASIFTFIPCIANWMDTDTCNSISAGTYSAININLKKLYIYTQEEYENSGISEYENGKASNELEDYKQAWGAWCDTGGIAGDFLVELCGNVLSLSGALPFVWETIFEDGLDIVYYKYSNCDLVSYDGPYTPFNVNCGLLNGKIFKFREAIANYTECNGDAKCKAKYVENMNKAEDDVKSYCSQILQSYDYNEGQKGCIDACLTIRESLNSFREGTDLYIDYSQNGECGLSARLTTWLVNILKWVKYILPVIVIILGILDFIKAIGADKEDEMKRAQKKFIKRLVAAALVFIIPLILEFILVKMGFGYNDCGLF